MSKLKDGTRIYGSLTVDAAIIAGAGAGFQNMLLLTTGTNIQYQFPNELRVPGAKFRVTIIGGGGGGAGSTAAISGACGGGGGSGGVVLVYLTVVSNAYGFTYSVGALGGAGAINTVGSAGGASSIIYNGVTYTAGGGAGGPIYTSGISAAGGTATGGTLNIIGGRGGTSGRAVSTNSGFYGQGGDTPLGYGAGGFGGGYLSASGAGVTGLSFGAGGGGGYSAAATGYAGAAGTVGLIILEY